jgi:thiopeptide-type bacteriocin biosynthesis protein
MTETEQIKLAADLADSGFFVLRTPLLPVEELTAWSEGVEGTKVWLAGDGSAVIAQAWQQAVALLRDRLRRLVARPEVRQALFVASPSLEAAIDIWEREPDSKKGLQAERALVRYFERMCSRPTPFGLFSGCSVGRLMPSGCEARTELTLAPRSDYRMCTRLDFDYLCALTANLRHDAAIAGEMRYWPNSSLHKIADTWHYIQSRETSTGRTHHVVKLYDDEYLAAVIERAEGGARVSELVEAALLVPAESATSETEAREYVQELIENEVVVPSLVPLVTGQSALEDIIRQLGSLPSGGAAARSLRSTQEGLAALDGKELGVPPAEYRAVASVLETLPAKVDISRLYQVDMIKPVHSVTLAPIVIEELKNGVEILCRLHEPGEPDELRRFRDAFVERYERAWVPLLEALDSEIGIGFGPASGADGSPLLKGLAIGGGATSPRAAGSSEFRALLFRKLSQCWRDDCSELSLELSDLPPYEAEPGFLPESFAVNVALVAPSAEAVDKGQFKLYLKGGAGPSGARMFGRFCHADPELKRYVERHLQEEEELHPEAVYAEVVHSPEGRIGNVLCRPVFRNYEILYLGRSGAPEDRQLPVTDLLVLVENGDILLYSRRLHKRVIPRLTNAHGFMNSALAPVYRFLCYMQHQHGANLPGFGWGPLEELDFLPRLRVGRFVLSCARWRISLQDVRKIRKLKSHDRFVAVQELRRRLKLPRWVTLAEYDNSLPVDLDNPLSVEAFVHALKYEKEIMLHEMYPTNADLCVSGAEGHFHSELMVPFVRRRLAAGAASTRGLKTADAGATKAPAILVPRATRSLPLGSDWLYLKLYGGVGALDDALLSAVAPLVQNALRSGLISRWFFIRYADPHAHLRIRFNGAPERLIQDLLPQLYAFHQLLVGGKVWKIAFDTYEREIERYGGVQAVLVAEDIFFADSEAVLAILHAFQGDEGLDARWRLALVGVDRLLSDCGFDLPTKRAVVEKLRDSYAREFQINAYSRRQLGDRYRSQRSALEDALARSVPLEPPYELASVAFDQRSSRLQQAVERLRLLAKSGALTVDIQELAASYAHMHINRLIRSSQRAHELVVYDFLFRLYDGQLARTRAPNHVAPPLAMAVVS